MAKRCFLSAKIHRAVVTEASLDYEGSISIDPDLLERSGILVHERVEVYNVTNGERFATYAILGQPGQICLNGAAAHKGRPGDLVIIATYAWLDEAEWAGWEPKIVLVGPDNRIKSAP